MKRFLVSLVLVSSGIASAEVISCTGNIDRASNTYLLIANDREAFIFSSLPGLKERPQWVNEGKAGLARNVEGYEFRATLVNKIIPVFKKGECTADAGLIRFFQVSTTGAQSTVTLVQRKATRENTECEGKPVREPLPLVMNIDCTNL